jgi:hypothetical protein
MGIYNSNNDDYGYEDVIQPFYEFFVDENGCYCPSNCDNSMFMLSFYNINDEYAQPVSYEKMSNMLVKIKDNIYNYCKTGIDEGYFDIIRIMNKIDYVVILSLINQDRYEYLPTSDDKKTVGFALLVNNNIRTNGDDNSLYIDIICSNNDLHQTRFPGGKVLLHHIVEFARLNEFNSVSLKSLSHVINYYRKYGFRFLKKNQNEESHKIHELAEMNKNRIIQSPSHANNIVLIERAIRFSREVDEDGRPLLNRDLLKENLKEGLTLTENPTDEQVEQFLSHLPTDVRFEGYNGLHDLFLELIKKGYADLNGCQNITRRTFVKLDEITPNNWKNWITCEEGGFQMRKILNPISENSSPIINCQTNANINIQQYNYGYDNSYPYNDDYLPTQKEFKKTKRTNHNQSGFLGGKTKTKLKQKKRQTKRRKIRSNKKQ